MTSKPAVLVVDDQPANRIALEALLDDFDIELLQAASGREALDLLAQHDVAVVLLDVQMPGMDGYEVAREMQEQARTRAVPINLSPPSTATWSMCCTAMPAVRWTS
jgi:CheY-like chemotaxis protein